MKETMSGQQSLIHFLGATKHLYNWLCPSVGWLAGRSVGNAFIRRTTRRTLLAMLQEKVHQGQMDNFSRNCTLMQAKGSLCS